MLRLRANPACETCKGEGGVRDWKIAGYGWGTVRGERNRQVWKPCHCGLLPRIFGLVKR